MPSESTDYSKRSELMSGQFGCGFVYSIGVWAWVSQTATFRTRDDNVWRDIIVLACYGITFIDICVMCVCLIIVAFFSPLNLSFISKFL